MKQKPIKLPLLVRCIKSRILTQSVDTVVTVDQNMRNHTGPLLTMEKRDILVLLMRQSINAKSSVETELVGIDNVINFVVRSSLFFDWKIKEHETSQKRKQLKKWNILLQENPNTI